MKLSDVAAQFDLDVVRDGELASLGLVRYESPQLLVFLESEDYLADLRSNPNVRCVITTSAIAGKLEAGLGVAIAASPRRAFYTLHNHLATTDFYGTPFTTEIAKSARVHPRAFVAERNVRIGERCVIDPNVTIFEGTVLADDVIVRAGTVLGGEGFQFASVGDELIPVAHVGGVRLERRSEVQHNTVIDRALFGGFTVVGEDTKIDNLVHIAHNVQLGRRNRVVAGAMIAGSVVSGDDVWFGPMCSVSDGLRVGARAAVSLGAVVTRDGPAGARVTGNFAIEHGRFIAHMKAIR